MNIRVTGQTQIQSAIVNLRVSTFRQARLQDQISSGIKVGLPSDDPGSYAAIARSKSVSQRYETSIQSIAFATNDLNAGVDALNETNRILTRAGLIASEGINATSDAASYEALATEVDGMINRMVEIANSRVDGKYLFSGTATDTPAYKVASLNAVGQPASITYQGSSDRVQTIIGQGQTVDTRYVGSELFQRSGTDVFKTLIQLRDDLRNPALANSAKADALTQRFAETEKARAAVGQGVAIQSSVLANLEALDNSLRSLKLSIDVRGGELEGTDYTVAILQLREQDQAFQATLAVSARLLQTNLLDFIR